jgi:hypothetical protein
MSLSSLQNDFINLNDLLMKNYVHELGSNEAPSEENA